MLPSIAELLFQEFNTKVDISILQWTLMISRRRIQNEFSLDDCCWICLQVIFLLYHSISFRFYCKQKVFMVLKGTQSQETYTYVILNSTNFTYCYWQLPISQIGKFLETGLMFANVVYHVLVLSPRPQLMVTVMVFLHII